MWVRTQDKEKLLKVDFFELDETRIYCNIADISGYNYVFLGQYSTKEKALKVLDIIEKYVGGKAQYYITKDNGNPNGYHVLNDMYIPMGYCRNGIFQMPQDSEVE